MASKTVAIGYRDGDDDNENEALKAAAAEKRREILERMVGYAAIFRDACYAGYGSVEGLDVDEVANSPEHALKAMYGGVAAIEHSGNLETLASVLAIVGLHSVVRDIITDALSLGMLEECGAGRPAPAAPSAN